MQKIFTDRLPFAYYFLAIFPALFVIGALTAYISIYFILGRQSLWVDDLDDFPVLEFIGGAGAWSLVLSIYSGMLWVLLFLANFTLFRSNIDMKAIGISAAIYLVAFALVFSPVTEWLMD